SDFQQEEESPQVLSVQEGENATMNCSYESSTITLQWYRQDSGKGPALVILIRSNEREKHSGRLTATLDTSTKRSVLSIMASQAADTATYFCATDTQRSAGTSLQNPQISTPASPSTAGADRSIAVFELLHFFKQENNDAWPGEFGCSHFDCRVLYLKVRFFLARATELKLTLRKFAIISVNRQVASSTVNFLEYFNLEHRKKVMIIESE
uniref:Ig-like domain-containing protein n=1 Tax=Spermophilus dauricus TaxID=99837 RepID=A0A8C9QBB7_SPEDA